MILLDKCWSFFFLVEGAWNLDLFTRVPFAAGRGHFKQRGHTLFRMIFLTSGFKINTGVRILRHGQEVKPATNTLPARSSLTTALLEEQPNDAAALWGPPPMARVKRWQIPRGAPATSHRPAFRPRRLLSAPHWRWATGRVKRPPGAAPLPAKIIARNRSWLLFLPVLKYIWRLPDNDGAVPGKSGTFVALL